MKTIGIIGAGQMGSGIAHVCALAGMDVLRHDVNEEAIESGLATLHSVTCPDDRLTGFE